MKRISQFEWPYRALTLPTTLGNVPEDQKDLNTGNQINKLFIPTFSGIKTDETVLVFQAYSQYLII